MADLLFCLELGSFSFEGDELAENGRVPGREDDGGGPCGGIGVRTLAKSIGGKASTESGECGRSSAGRSLSSASSVARGGVAPLMAGSRGVTVEANCVLSMS